MVKSSEVEKKIRELFKDFSWDLVYCNFGKEDFFYLLFFEKISQKKWDNFLKCCREFFSFMDSGGYDLFEIWVKREGNRVFTIALEFREKENVSFGLRDFFKELMKFLILFGKSIVSMTIQAPKKKGVSISFHYPKNQELLFNLSSIRRTWELIISLVLGIIGVEKKGFGFCFKEEEIKEWAKILEGKSLEEVYTFLKLLKGLE